MEVLLESEFIAYKAGVYFSVLIRISLPIKEREDWLCFCEITTLFPHAKPVWGVDALQSLSLAVDLVKQGLSDFLDTDGKLFFRTGEPFTHETLKAYYCSAPG